MKAVFDKLAGAVALAVPFIVVLFGFAQLINLVKVNAHLGYLIYIVLGGVMALGVVWTQFLSGKE
jgi:hypothetical protein